MVQKTRLSWSFNQEKIEQEQLLDGCYVIYTDVAGDDMIAIEVVNGYKSLMKIEQAFRNLKPYNWKFNLFITKSMTE